MRRAGSIVLLFWAAFGPDSFPDGSDPPFRMAFSSGMFTEVNEGDARAAMKVWILTIAKDRGLPVDPDPHICRNVEELTHVGKSLNVEAFGFTMPEYPALSRHFNFDRIALSSTDGSVTEEYLVLVHRDSGFSSLAQLKGRSLNLLQGPRMGLAAIWFETQLLEAGHGRTADFMGRVSTLPKSSTAVLQVFFRQVDACVVNRTAFKLLGELNPQLDKQLRVLAASPGMVPAGFAFRADVMSINRPQILAEMTSMTRSPAGRQILTLTQSDAIADYPISFLDESLALIAKHERLCAAALEEQAPQAAEGGAR